MVARESGPPAQSTSWPTSAQHPPCQGEDQSSLVSEPDCCLYHLRVGMFFPGLTAALFIWVGHIQVCVAWRGWHVNVCNRDECTWV